MQAEDCNLYELALNQSHSEGEDFKSVAARSLLKLKSSHRLSQRALDDIIQMNTDITQSVCKRIKTTTLQILEAHNVSMNYCEEVQAHIERDVHTEPFKDIHTAYLQNKYISTNFPYIVSIHAKLYS